TTTVVYLLDTSAPAVPVLTAPASPSPIEQPVWIWTAESGVTAVCTVTDSTGKVVQGPVVCSSPFAGAFRRLPDGTYTLTVVVTDDAGNHSAPATSTFILDRQAPVPPSVVPPRSPDNAHHPQWQISAPRGALLTCTLLHGRTVIFGPAACPADGVFSLVGMPDGTYTLRVTATDSAGNVSAVSVSTYVLDTTSPAAPRLDYHSPSPSTSTSPFWGFTLPVGTTGRCVLMRNGTVISSRPKCTGAVSFDLSGRPAGTYTVQIVAVDAAGNVSKPLVVTYVLGHKSPVVTPPPPDPGPTDSGTGGHHPNGSNGGKHHPAPSPGLIQHTIDRLDQLAGGLRNGGKKAVHHVVDVATRVLPAIHDRFTEDVSSAVQGVVDAVSHAGGGTGFPLLLLLVVLMFLLMQNRIDRRDPKLALASVAADDTVEFLPPPSRGAEG
ncbi:MAG: large repetitive protein, partial [Frankiaceae bacterium]|nr:large repetitive protein [Frankiaceae bacterium]